MWNERAVEEVLDKALKEHWPYPKAFDALKAAGVTHYDVQIATCRIVYAGDGGTYESPKPSDFVALYPNSRFNLVEFKAALARTQRGQTTYVQFLKEIAEAGIHTYHVQMSDRTVIYRGSSGESQVEKVPLNCSQAD